MIAATWPDDFSQIATAGYYVALRIGFAFPVEERNVFPPEWIEFYTANGLMMFDPVMRWMYSNTGAIRWNEIEIDDPLKVRVESEKFGLKYGAAVSCPADPGSGQRSFGTFSRPDRDFTNEELETLEAGIRQLHSETEPPNLTEAELEALRYVRDGYRFKEIAYHLGISEGAIKQRLSGAKRKLGAKNNAQAATLATEYRLLV